MIFDIILCVCPGPIFSALTLTLNLHFSLPFCIGFKGKLTWSGEYESCNKNNKSLAMFLAHFCI